LLAVPPHSAALQGQPVVKPRHEPGIVIPSVREEDIERRGFAPSRSAFEKYAEDVIAPSRPSRIEGTCIKHRFGKCSIKMYDKHGIVLRIETTTNDVSFFKHHRRVEHRKGPASRELAPVKKSIYSPIDLREIPLGCNRRYIANLSALDDFSAGSGRKAA
jgi:hypothetical protein